MKPNRFFAILRQIAQKGGEWDVTQVAASMAFYTLFSLFPLILLLISIGSVLLKNPGTVDQILRFVGETLPAAQVLVNENITNLVQQRGPIGLVGFVSLLWSASNVFTTLSAHINSAWPASKKRNYLETRLVGLGIVGAMVIALVGYILGTILLQLMTWLRLPILGDPRLSNAETWGRVWQLLAWLVVMGLLFGIYRWVPKTYVPWQAALASGAITTLILVLLSRILASLLTLITHHYELVYGSLGAFVVFMFYIYLINLIVLIGAHLSAAISRYFIGEAH
jgi:membrane protein